MKKLISIILSVCMIFSVCSAGVFAVESENTVAISCEEDLENLERDVPLIFVIGLQGSYYKGVSTETEDDDVRIWGPSTDVILKVVFKYAFSLIWNLATKDYDEVAEISANVTDALFGAFACDDEGNPDPDTGKKETSDYELVEVNGYENSYEFIYDWRLDILTVAEQLDEYVEDIMELTGSDKVAFAAMSMGNAVMTTYLHEYYYTAEDYDERNHIDSVVFIAGAMNGVGTCEDPFSGHMSIDSTSVMRLMAELMRDNKSTKVIYYLLEILYSLGLLEPIADYANDLTQLLITDGFTDAVINNIATIPGFYALMSPERYEQTKAFLFDTPEKQARFSPITEVYDYYHNEVQANSEKVIQSLIDDSVKVAIIAEYGCTFIPVTSDNDRMSDGTIATDRESFGATCAEVDGTLGDGYVQAEECACGKNHISADNQIDASTCAFPDITWFGKYLRHDASDRFLAELVDLIVYSDRQITVWDYTEYPQFLVNLDDECLVPLTEENAGKVVPYEETTLFSKFFKF